MPSQLSPNAPATARYLGQLLLLGMLYYVGSRLRLQIAIISPTVTLIWPTGIALGMCFLFGLRLWPAVMVAAFAAYLPLTNTTAAAGVAVGNTLAVAAAVVVLRQRRFKGHFKTLREVQDFALVSLVATTIGGLSASLWLCGTGMIGWSRFFDHFVGWWLGDFSSVFLLAPTIINWPRSTQSIVPPGRRASGLVSTLVILVQGFLLYSGSFSLGPWQLILAFVPFLVVLRSAILKSLWLAMVQMNLQLGFMVWGLVEHQGPLTYLHQEVWVYAVWGYMAALELTILLTASVVSELSAVERRLRQGENNYRALIEDVPALICHFHADGELFFANETFRRLFDLKAGATAGMNLYSVAGLREETEFFARLQLLRVNEVAETPPIRIGTTLGPRWLRWTARPVQIASGAGVEFHAVGMDVTAQIDAEERRRAMEVQAIQTHKLESVGMIADGLAHEFNNLLTGVMGNAELAQYLLAQNAEAMPLLAEVVRNAQKAADLTRQLQNYSSRDTAAPPGPLDLSELIRNVETLMTIAVPKRCTFCLDLGEGLPLILGSDLRLRQLLMSLVTNAGEAVQATGGHVSIRTGLVDFDSAVDTFGIRFGDTTPGPRLLLQVEDEGDGIREPDRGRIFEPFYTTRTPGRGLGLPAALAIVEEHGGTLGLGSLPGRGTVVSVLLPLLDPHPAAGVRAHRDCRFCSSISDETATPPEFTLPLPPFQKVGALDRSGWSSQVRSRSRRPKLDF